MPRSVRLRSGPDERQRVDVDDVAQEKRHIEARLQSELGQRSQHLAHGDMELATRLSVRAIGLLQR